MNKVIVVSVMALISGCSTIDRRTYYEPQVESTQASGPRKLYCGFMNFGGSPDTYEGNIDGHQIHVSVSESIAPYLWGPWFASVLPVFPITWVVKALDEDNIEVWVSSEDLDLEPLSRARFVAKFGEKESLGAPQLRGPHALKVAFPIEKSDVQDFQLVAEQSDTRILDVPFRRTARWAWSQWSPNC
jgi:hypothetical protein